MVKDREIISRLSVVIGKYAEYIQSHSDNVMYYTTTQVTEMYTLLSDTLTRYAPKSSGYYAHTVDIIKKRDMNSKSKLYGDIKLLFGILSALHTAYSQGLLYDLEELIRGEIFDDFLEMAEYLLEEGYKDPAAVLIGGVLEEHLRKLCLKNEIAIKTPDGKPKSGGVLNDDLYKGGIYNKGDFKSIIAWLEIRNNAAHGKYNEYSEEQVDLMLKSIRDFILRCPA
jgi:hypothetical protein